MKIHHCTAEEAIKTLHSQAGGLTSLEALRRLREYGPNRVEKVAAEALWQKLLRGFTHFFAIILWSASALAFFAEWHDPHKGMATLALAIIGVIFINAIFSFWQERQAEKALMLLEKFLPGNVKVMRDSKIKQLDRTELVPGDVIVLSEGDSVPADCRLIEAAGLRVNNATITGESVPLLRDAENCDQEELIHSHNILLAGTEIYSGHGRGLVFATGIHSEFGKIAQLTQTAGERLSPLQKEVAYLSRIIAVLSIAMGLIFFFVGQALGFPFWGNFIFAIGIIVANVPEGLLPTVTLALAMGSQRMAKKAALIRHLPSVETLGSATVICTDKTGTLTENRMTVKKVWLGESSYETSERAQLQHLVDHYRQFFECSLLCQDVKETEHNGQLELTGDPMEIALIELARSAGISSSDYLRVDELPFDTARKRMAIIFNNPAGRRLYAKGALETLLPHCSGIMMAGGVRPLTDEMRQSLLKAQIDMAGEGLRVLAFAYRDLPAACPRENWEEELIVCGFTGLEDPPRPEVPDAIEKCKQAGIKVIMLTGDHPITAKAIAREIGLAREPRIATGEELKKISDTQLQLMLDLPEILFARLAPDQKMRIVSALKRKGEIVAVTGDGVNDAPALKMADIGIAMGSTGTDVAREAADMVLLDDNFANIVSAIEEGRAVFDNIRKFLTYILSSNIAEVVPYLAFVIFKIPLALTIIQILAIDLGTDMLPALALGTERPEADVMRRPPRRRDERLINLPLINRAYLFLGVMEAIAGMATFFYVLHNGGWRYGEPLSPNSILYLQATSACLSAVVVMQIANLFICRSATESIFTYGLSGNRLLLWGIATEVALILLIVYTPLGNRIFGTSPINARVWLYVVPFALAMIALEEMRKWWIATAVKTRGQLRRV